MRHDESKRVLVRTVERYECEGLGITHALRTIVTDPGAGWIDRSDAAGVLAIAEDGAVAERLLQQFFSQEGKDELWETALTLERLDDVRSVGPLIQALSDQNHDRRHAAARALGWIRNSGSRAVNALINALTGGSQPPPVRAQAAEAPAYHPSSPPI